MTAFFVSGKPHTDRWYKYKQDLYEMLNMSQK